MNDDLPLVPVPAEPTPPAGERALIQFVEALARRAARQFLAEQDGSRSPLVRSEGAGGRAAEQEAAA